MPPPPPLFVFAPFSLDSPARKTITKTASVKKTTTITKTVVPTGPASVKGRLYVDINNNRVYDPNIDIPIGNSAVNLIRNTTKLARAGSVIGTTVSDPLGLFYFYGVSTIPLELLQIVLQANPNLVLATVQITGTGTPNANIPFAPNQVRRMRSFLHADLSPADLSYMSRLFLLSSLPASQPLCMNFTITTTTTKSSTATITTTLSVTSTRTVTQTPTWSPCPAVPTTVACPACPTTVPPVPTTTKTGGLVCNTPYGVFTTMYLNAVNSTTYLWSSTLTSTSTFVTVTTTTSYSPTEDVYEDTLTYSYYSSTLTGTQYVFFFSGVVVRRFVLIIVLSPCGSLIRVNVVTETSYGEYVTTSATLCGPTTTAGPS